jgi:hypothetical protein
MQADAAALMAVHEAEVSDAWVEEDGFRRGCDAPAYDTGKELHDVISSGRSLTMSPVVQVA